MGVGEGEGVLPFDQVEVGDSFAVHSRIYSARKVAGAVVGKGVFTAVFEGILAGEAHVLGNFAALGDEGILAAVEPLPFDLDVPARCKRETVCRGGVHEHVPVADLGIGRGAEGFALAVLHLVYEFICARLAEDGVAAVDLRLGNYGNIYIGRDVAVLRVERSDAVEEVDSRIDEAVYVTYARQFGRLVDILYAARQYGERRERNCQQTNFLHYRSPFYFC